MRLYMSFSAFSQWIACVWGCFCFNIGQMIHRKTKKSLSVSETLQLSKSTELGCLSSSVCGRNTGSKWGGTRAAGLCVAVRLSVGKGMVKVDAQRVLFYIWTEINQHEKIAWLPIYAVRQIIVQQTLQKQMEHFKILIQWGGNLIEQHFGCTGIWQNYLRKQPATLYQISQ